MGILDSVKKALRGAVAAPSPPPDSAVAEPESVPPQEPETAVEESTYDVYTVRTGDTLGEIGARHGVGRDELARFNGIDEPDLIFPGQEIRVPTR